MSAYREQETKMNDAEALCDALKDMGVKEVQKHEKAVQLEGYHGDKRKDTAEIVIPRRVVGHASNDIGFKKGPDGNFKAIISDYDRSKHDAKWLNKLKQTYAEKKIMKQAKVAGLVFTGKKTTAQGNTQLLFSKL